VKREYLIIRDLFNGPKPEEYSIYDVTGENLQYRIESKFHILHSLEVIAYPAKKVVGKLQSKFNLFRYKANFEIYDDRYKRWFKGVINQTHFRHDIWKIEYNGRLLSIEYRPYSKAFKGKSMIISSVDKNGTNVLAEYQYRWSSIYPFGRYLMEVSSNEIPDIVYFLYIAAVKHNAKYRKG
jgi:hypothetical protein